MNLKKKKLYLRVLSMLITVSMFTSMAVPCYAVDTLEQSSYDLQNELSTLNRELEALNSDISSIANQIAATSEEITQTKSELAIAKGNQETQYDSMKARIKYMYENANYSMLEMLFSASCLADFLKRAEFVSTVAEYDKAQLEKLVETQETIEAKEEELAQKHDNLLALQEKLSEKEATLNSKISSTSAELSSVNAQLEKVKAEAEKAKAEAEKAKKELEKEVKPVVSSKPETSNNNGSSTSNTTSNSGSSSSSGVSSGSNTTISSSASDVELFAALIECEAGSTDYEGMLAVASVVVNRMNSPYYPNTVRGVICQAGQFTPFQTGKVDRVLRRGVKASCVTVANDALAGKNNVGSCLNFRAASSGHTGILIGNNVFF